MYKDNMDELSVTNYLFELPPRESQQISENLLKMFDTRSIFENESNVRPIQIRAQDNTLAIFRAYLMHHN